MIGTRSRYKVAILDNCEIEALYRLDMEHVPVEITLESYDVILIPGRVWIEICDSKFRKNYVKSLIEKGLPIKILPEERYIEIVNKELVLLKFFHMAIRPYIQIKSYFNKYILKRKEEAEIDYLYEEWIKKVYNEWPIKGAKIEGVNGNSREKRKNAGEISITFLACLIKYRMKEDVELTIWSHDSDCKYCVDIINEQLCKVVELKKEVEKIILTYKNIDIILKELFEKNIINIQEIDQLIDKVRNQRRMIYILKKNDNTYELREEVIDHIKMIDLILTYNSGIIW